MGLDMYLYKKKYISRSDDDKKLKITGVTGVDNKNVRYIVEEIGYWRKANAIHKWFVDNVQNGEDDCKSYYVEREDLSKLLNLVNTVLENSKLVKGKIQNGYTFKNGKEEPIMEDGEYIENPAIAEKLLPTQEGFFFGGTNYDQYYIQDLKQTKEIIEKALKNNDIYTEYEYTSSW